MIVFGYPLRGIILLFLWIIDCFPETKHDRLLIISSCILPVFGECVVLWFLIKQMIKWIKEGKGD